MANVILISKNSEYKRFLNKFNPMVFGAFEEEILDFDKDIIILDSEIENSKMILMNLISKNSPKEFEIFCIVPDNEIESFTKSGVRILTKPINQKILENEVSLTFESISAIKAARAENMELKKNLYQIDAFYSASSKFAGTLEKEKLYEVMFETFERILSFDVACALFWDNLEEDKLKFYIHSLKRTTEDLNNSLIKRLALSANKEGISELKPTRCEIETIQNIKPSYKNEFYDSNLMNFDTLFAPIVIKNKFIGAIEIFRKNPFTKEDITCFQSIVHQVLAPLRGAILYEEVTNTNVKLKKLERIKSEFVSIVSHELRTPLTPINNALSIILSEQGGKIGDTNKNFANIAKRNVSRLSGIIEDLLDLSRIQTGKFDFKFKKASLYPSLELAYNTFKNQALAKNIEFCFNAPENLPDAYIDSHRIDQILSNLITNAVKFTPEDGKIEITGKLVKEIPQNSLVAPVLKEYKGEYIQISVKDTGVGIEKEDIPKIFDKFSQIENTLSRNTGGIGLGLTITKHFTDAHLGGIWVESAKNEGSVFNVIIPVYSELKAFEAELNLKIKNETEIGYFKIIEPINGKFFTKLKNSNIIKLTKDSREITYNSLDKQISEVFITNLHKNAFDFMESKIEEEINSCDIVLSKAYYKRENN